MTIRAWLIGALAAATLIAPAGAGAAASLPDIEDEVMCPICGTLLELSESPQAERQRAFIRRLIAEGRTKEEIVEAMVAEYGQEVLALPDNEGFDLVAWLLPGVALLVIAGAVGVAVRRWRSGRPSPAPAGDSAASERLDEDLSRYDL
jgi:cytochrome c-type biogenesis protein CcmH/NrfF